MNVTRFDKFQRKGWGRYIDIDFVKKEIQVFRENGFQIGLHWKKGGIYLGFRVCPYKNRA